jgi:hypothetical protein
MRAVLQPLSNRFNSTDELFSFLPNPSDFLKKRIRLE